MELSFKTFMEVVSGPSVVYHGTSRAIGEVIQKEGILKPRGKAQGNWGGGPFGGNPSNPDLVYCTIQKEGAIEYAKDIARRTKEKGLAIVTVIPNWSAAVVDEDIVLDLLQGNSPLSGKAWTAYAKVMDMDIQAAKQYFNDDEMNPYSIDDATLAGDMKLAAEYLTPLLSQNEFPIVFQSTVAFRAALPVQRVEFM